MADTFQFDLVSPERRLASFPARRAQIPGTEGEFTAMPNHAPFLTTLKPGFVEVTGADGAVTSYLVTGGFAEVSPEATAVLAERALPREEVRPELIAELEAAARSALDEASPETRTAAAQRLNDVRALASRTRG
jgi:F-type H+-transporting ATPase subunit epsilon